jgi:hypothetical protein
MGKIKLLGAALLCWTCLSAQTVMNTGYLQITLNRNVLQNEGGVCLLDSAGNDIYLHSGAGYKTNTSVWDVVVGNWGLADGVGAMTFVSDSIQTICMNLTGTNNYFQNAATYNLDSGPLPVGDNIYNIGVVFRWAGPWPQVSGQPILNNNWKGAGPTIDNRNQCEDIWLLGVNSDSLGHMVQPITIQGEDQDPIPAVTAQWVSAGVCSSVNGIQDISSQLFDGIRVSPNPFYDNVTIQFNMAPDVSKVQAQVYDVMGRKVADFSQALRSGYNSFSWNGAGPDGIALPAGTYLLKVTNGGKTDTAKLIKL